MCCQCDCDWQVLVTDTNYIFLLKHLITKHLRRSVNLAKLMAQSMRLKGCCLNGFLPFEGEQQCFSRMFVWSWVLQWRSVRCWHAFVR
jgi:hypothetical protein